MVEHEPQRLDWIADRHPLDGDAERCGRAPARRFQVAFDLALEKIGDPARDMRLGAGDAEQRSPVVAGSRSTPCRAARAGARCGDRRRAAASPCRARNGAGSRQPVEPRRDPAAVLLGEFARLLQAAARRHGEHALRGVTEWMRSV